MSQSLIETWGPLVDAAQRLKVLSPWEWMVGAPIFGVEDSASGELGFVILPRNNEVTVFRGAQGLHGLLYCRREPSPHYPERILEFAQFQLTFTSQDQLHADDLLILRQLGREFHGPQAWPLFRSVWPGYQPWFLEVDEVTFFTCVLEQTLAVSAQYRTQPSQLAQSGTLDYLVRVQRNGGHWDDQVRHIAQPLDTPVQIMMDVPLLERVRELPHGLFDLEMDLFRVQMQRENTGERPCCVYMLLAVDASLGLILGHELLNPITTLDAMWGLVGWKAVTIFAKLGQLPRQVRVRSPLLGQLLLDVADDLDVDLRQMDHLLGIDASRAILNQLAR